MRAAGGGALHTTRWLPGLGRRPCLGRSLLIARRSPERRIKRA